MTATKPGNKITRRQALIGASATFLLPIARASVEGKAASKSDSTFLHGVASGDPDTTSVVIWTRVSNTEGRAKVNWQVSLDENFETVLASGRLDTDARRDHTVKVVVDSLMPGQTYFYQFEFAGVSSPVGRTKTLPVGHVESLALAVVTCSNYAFGYFNAYEVIAQDSKIDLVVHLGDYIYEHGTGEYGGEEGRRIGRDHKPAHETVTLDDYRQRHAQYKQDSESKAMHARHPLVVIWDDHETANNPWMGGALNHQENEGDWETRRSNSMQAFYEWLPIREPHHGGTREAYWRHYKFGDLVSLITLESRHTGRSIQIEIDDYLDDLKNKADVKYFTDNVIGAPDRKMLSKGMEDFLASELSDSVRENRRWRIIGNQSVMAKRTVPDLNKNFFTGLRKELNNDAKMSLDHLTHLGDLELPPDLDSWNGYSVAREKFYQLSKEAGVRDLLVLAGDSHSNWQNELYDAEGNSMGVELGAAGITSPRSLLKFGEKGLKRFDELNAASNKEVIWTEGRFRGFIRLDISHQGVRADFVTVSNVASRSYTSKTIRSVNIRAKDGKLSYAT